MSGGPTSPRLATAAVAFPILHSALTVGAVVAGGACVVLARNTAPIATGATGMLWAVAALEMLTFAVLLKSAGGRIAPVRAGDDPAWWWTANGPRVIVLWILGEGTTVIGAVFWYVARDPLLSGALVALGLGSLVWLRPGRVARG